MVGIFRRIPASNSHHGETIAARGFTIVELLIVIVVIAILAAIVFVAYNGITGRANASSAQAAAEQAAQGLKAYAVTNGSGYPSTLSAAGINPSGNTTFQYAYNNSASPATFCVTATTANVSYYVDSSAHTTPTAGACAGQAPNGGTVVTNLVIDPEATGVSVPNGSLGWEPTRWFGFSPAAGQYTQVTGAADGPAGISTYFRKTWSAVPSSVGWSSDTGFDTSPGGNGGVAVTTSETLTFSCYLRPSVVRGLQIGVYQNTSTGASFSTARVFGPMVLGPANQWTRISYTYTVPTGVAFVYPACDSQPTSGASNWAVGSTLDGTGLMATQGSTLYNFADGNSPGWIWNGTPNDSTSTGPAS